MRVPAVEGSQLQSFAYDGKSRVLEIEFRMTAPFAYTEVPLPPPPRVIQYFDVPLYVFTKLGRYVTARSQERFWEGAIQRRFKCQTVRTVCRLPRIYRVREARNTRRHRFEDYLLQLSLEEQQALPIVIAAMKILLLRTLKPRHVAGLGGLIECQSCGSVGPVMTSIRHRNCLWSAPYNVEEILIKHVS